MEKSFYEHIQYELQERKAFLEANLGYKQTYSNIVINKDKREYLETLYTAMPVDYEEIISPKDFKELYQRFDSYTLNDMLEENRDLFLDRNPNLKIRDVVKSEVQKTIKCKDPKYGHATYLCEDCDKVYTVPFTCKSRFCTSCGIKYQLDRAISISEKLIDCKHRHIVFTIPQELRIYFRTIPKLLDVLFKAAQQTILYRFNEINKSKKFVPGIIMVLHTFGRSLGWNPHIHCLVTEGGSSANSNLSSDTWRSVTHFNYEAFRKSFQKVLLDLMKKKLKKALSNKCFREFQNLVNQLYKNFNNGFYVRAKSDFRDGKYAIKYLIRYFNRPVIASSHILFYDSEYVVFYYQRHQDDQYVLKKVHIDEFFKMLIIHIPEKNFKMLRYAGIYSSHKCNNFNNIQKRFSSLCIKIMRKHANWRDRIKSSFNRDPLICPHCKKLLVFFNYHYP